MVSAGRRATNGWFEMGDAKHAVVLPLNQERRRHQRVKVALTGRFMREDRQEYPCQTINMSPGGVLLATDHPAKSASMSSPISIISAASKAVVRAPPRTAFP